MDKKKLTDEEVTLMLEQLSEHYGEPVLRMSKFCNAISTWFRCIVKLNKTNKGASNHYDYADHLWRIERDIRKSNLLARLLYAGEEFRTEPCPAHNGHLHMGRQDGPCLHGCDYTGWLPK